MAQYSTKLRDNDKHTLDFDWTQGNTWNNKTDFILQIYIYIIKEGSFYRKMTRGERNYILNVTLKQR